jgi:hypothetical protein
VLLFNWAAETGAAGGLTSVLLGAAALAVGSLAALPFIWQEIKLVVRI